MSSFEELKSEGNKAYGKREFEKALEYYEKCLQLLPNEHVIHSNRCLCYINLEKYEEAIIEVEKALKLSNNHAKSYYNYGVILLNQKKYEESLVKFKKAYYLDNTDNCARRIEEVELLIQEKDFHKFENSLEEKYVATMVLSSVGDAIGFNNGSWEFCFQGKRIHQELENLGGLEKLKITPEWLVSDDTVMHLATGETLMKTNLTKFEDIMQDMANEYVECFNDMMGRSPGPTTGSSIYQLRRMKWDEIEYNKSGGGCVSF